MRFGVTFVTLCLVGTPAFADALLDSALSHGGAWSAQDWAYVSTTRVNAGGSTVIGETWDRLTGGSKAGAQPTRDVRIVSFDPSKPAGKRQVVLSDSSGSASGGGIRVVDLRKGHQTEMINSDEKDKLPSYDDLRQMVKPDAVKVGDTVATATYRFQTPLKDLKHVGSADIDIDTDTPILLNGTAVVQKTGPFAPYVKTVVIYLPTGDRGRGNAAGKIKLLSMGFRFEPDPVRGVELLRAFGFDSRFQALGLMSVGASFLNRVDGYRFVGKK